MCDDNIKTLAWMCTSNNVQNVVNIKIIQI